MQCNSNVVDTVAPAFLSLHSPLSTRTRRGSESFDRLHPHSVDGLHADDEHASLRIRKGETTFGSWSLTFSVEVAFVLDTQTIVEVRARL